MKNFCFLLLSCALSPLFIFAQHDSLLSGKYVWKLPQSHGDLSEVTLFEGKVHDMEWLQMNAQRLAAGGLRTEMHVPSNEEHLIIIKSGLITLLLADSTYTLGAGSVVLLMPGESFTLQNSSKAAVDMYLMKYRSKRYIDSAERRSFGRSMVKNWNTIEYKTHEKGGRRNFFDLPTAMSRRFEMHVTTLNKGFKSHDPHTHLPEEIILVTDGSTEMQVGDRFYTGGVGSIYYLGSNVPHAIRNTGTRPCTYFAFQFE
jgi:(S)-ureidoglycine aminohydrolase